MNTRRSIPPACLAPLADIPGLHYITLQHGDAAADPPPVPLFDPMPRIGNFDDTAALIANLDLVVAVDTAVAHLAGGLGKPVWMLSRADACWRWLANRTTSPWYPTLRVYRQDRPGDWTGAVGRLARDLSDAPPWR